MKTYLLEVIPENPAPVVRMFCLTLEYAMDRLIEAINGEAFVSGTIYQGQLETFFTYTNPRRPQA